MRPVILVFLIGGYYVLFLLYYYLFVLLLMFIEYVVFIFSGVASALNITNVYRRENFKYYTQIFKITFFNSYNLASGSGKVRSRAVNFRTHGIRIILFTNAMYIVT
jgi:hypothetical protein